MKTLSIFCLLLLSGLVATCQVAPASSSSTVNSGNFTTASTTTGNAKPFASAGCVELGGSFSFTIQSYSNISGVNPTPSSTFILFAPYFGYFPVQGLELGLNPFSVSSTSDGTGTTLTSLLFMFAPSYNFNTHSIAFPFVEGELGFSSYLNGNYNESGLCYGGRAGVKLAITSHVLLNISLQYFEQNFTSNGITESGLNNTIIGLGFTVYL